MRPLALATFALVAIAAIACSQTPTTPTTYTVPLVVSDVKTGSPLSSTHLKGHEEVPARDTDAQGQPIMKGSEDGVSVCYKVIVANINNVVQSHIHIGPVGVNGPIVVFLAGPFPSGGGRRDGVLAEGRGR